MTQFQDRQGAERSKSAGPNLANGRLARYAAQGRMCRLALGTLAQDIGVGSRQAQQCRAELENARLTRRRTGGMEAR